MAHGLGPARRWVVGLMATTSVMFGLSRVPALRDGAVLFVLGGVAAGVGSLVVALATAIRHINGAGADDS